jgi:hypothetical protein
VALSPRRPTRNDGDNRRGRIVPTVTQRPSAYPRQAGLTCGEYTARAVVSAFGIEFDPPAPRRRVRMFGYSYLSDLQSLLRDHGLDAPIRSARDLDDDARLALLIGHVDRDEPVIVAVGNGHVSRNRYIPGLRFLVGHFLTVYGYDADRRVFHVYDSYLSGSPHPVPPIGNEERSFDAFLRGWRGPFYYRAIGMKHAYIPVRRRTD